MPDPVKDTDDPDKSQDKDEDSTALFDEFTKEKEEPEPAKDPEKPASDPEPKGDPEPKSDPEKKPDQDPEKEEDPKKPKGDEDPKKPDEKDADPWEDLPEAVADKFAALEKERDEAVHKLKSDEGRVTGLQKKLKDEREKNKKPTVAVDEFTAAFKDQDSWKTFKEEHPEISGPVEEFMTGLAQVTNDNLKKNTESQQGLQEVADAQADKDAGVDIAGTHPDWLEWVATKDFKEWMERQPASQHEIVADGSTEETISLLSNYKNHMTVTGILKPEPSKDEDEKSEAEIAKVKEKRDKQLKDGATTPEKSGSAKPIGDSNSEGLFDYFADKRK